MEVAATTKDGILRLTLKGRFDTFGAGAAQRELDAHYPEHPRFIIMDLTGVDFISSAGIRVLLITLKEAQARKGALALIGLQAYCRDVIKSVHVADFLRQFDSMDQAEAFCKAAGLPAESARPSTNPRAVK